MNCLEIIKNYLEKNGFDGLCSNECGCLLPDIVPCCSDFSKCIPGYNVAKPENLRCEFDYYICPSKDDKSWEIDLEAH